jgi:D-amino-acid oxidase
MSGNAKKITIIGCGVIGLSSGIRLLEAGFDVEIVARELPPDTTSDVAAAIWYPYRCFPQQKVLRWGKQTLETCYKLTKVPDCGVSIVQFTEYLPQPTPDPWWKNTVKQFRRLSPENLPVIYKDGYHFEVPFIDSSLHMPWLVERFKKPGGKIRKAAVQNIEEIDSAGDIIINCAGIGAEKLAKDKLLYPVKGQSIRIRGTNDGGYYLDQHGSLALCYVLPRSDDIVLGGSAIEHDSTTEPEVEITEQIIRKARQLDPSLRIDRVKHVAAGLRPARPEVRLEAEQKNGRLIIHNYGHGGAGYTLSWGCAEEVVELVLNHN